MQDDNRALREHWNSAFRLTDEEKEKIRNEAGPDDGWKDMAPSEKLLGALRSFADRQNVLDYGSGSGWAGIAMAKYGCPRVTCADAAPNAAEMAALYADRFGVRTQVHPVCISDTWLRDMPDNTYDGFFCSNVLDVVPPETAEAILQNTARIVSDDSIIMIGLNYYMQPETAAECGFTVRNENRIYIDGILRLVTRTDEEWAGILERYFRIDRLDHFAWPGEKAEMRRLFYLRRAGV